jgi:alpha-mannosidase
VTVKIDRSKGWAITSFAVNGTEVLTPNGVGNSIRIYQDDGNIYQFGNEPLTGPGKFGKFADTATIMTGGAGEWLEWGPLRWHFRATITGQYSGQPYSYTLDYLLLAGESVLRMRLTGAAPTKTSVLTRFDLGPAADGARYGLTYGTANHYDDNEPVPYWTGPTFRATHDFVQTTGTPGPGLAIYHQAVPAWSIVDKVDKDDKYKHLLGALLRNPTGDERGAVGDDYGVHTLEYALGSAGNSQVTTGDALRTALTVTNPLVGAVIDPAQRANIVLPKQASLAAITSAGGTTPAAGILRAARTQAGHSMVAIPYNDGYYAERISFILRAYVPSPSPQGRGVTIALPSLPNPGTYGYDPDLRAALVTALEEPTEQQKGMTVSRTSGPGGAPQYSIQFSADRALATVQVTVTRSPTTPASGK